MCKNVENCVKGWYNMYIKKCKYKRILIRSNSDGNEGGTNMINPVLQNLQSRLQNNINKAIKIAEKNTTKNSMGQAVLSADDEWRDECEWDTITNIFQRAIQRKNLSKDDVDNMAKNILKEVRSSK